MCFRTAGCTSVRIKIDFLCLSNSFHFACKIANILCAADAKLSCVLLGVDFMILLKQDGITPEQQEKITDKMILVADKIADLHEDNRNFLEGIIKYGTPLIGGALLLGAVILGVNVKGTKLPTINGKK